MPRRQYRGAAAPLVLSAPITTGTLVFTTTGDVTGWPPGGTAKFYIEIDRGVDGKAEKILVTSRSGNTFTVGGSGDRGADDTLAVAHAAGAAVEHVLDSESMDDANAHVFDETRDDHDQYLTVERHDVEARHLLGTSVPTGVPGTVAFGDSPSEGASTAAARSDHKHGMPALGIAGDVSTSHPGDTAAAGTATTPAHADHRHPREAWGVAGDYQSVDPSDTADAGNSGRVADAAHRHPAPALPQVPALSSHSSVHATDQGLNPGDDFTIESVTFTSGGNRVLMIFAKFAVVSASAGTNYAGSLTMYLDGALDSVGDRWNINEGSDSRPEATCMWFRSVSAGSHTVLIKASNDIGSDGLVFVSNRILQVGELGG